MNIQEVIQTCESRVSLSAVCGSLSVCDSLCVDGTSATRKSTILSESGCIVHKIQRQTNAVDMDTYFPSAIGYSCFGICTQNCDAPHLYDRSHLNPFEWRLLWAVMDDYVRRNGNSRPDEDSTLWRSYRRLFEDLRESYHYSYLRKRINALAIIDSNVARCDDARRRRDCGSDRERSDWLFYTPLQNLMYSTLYPNAMIDLAWFDCTEAESVTSGLALWISSALRRISQNVAPQSRVSYTPLRLPVAFRNLTLANVTSHMYRSLRRVACKREQEIADSSDGDSTDSKERLRRYQPAYVTVKRASDSSSPGLLFDLPGSTRPDLKRKQFRVRSKPRTLKHVGAEATVSEDESHDPNYKLESMQWLFSDHEDEGSEPRKGNNEDVSAKMDEIFNNYFEDEASSD